MENHIEKSILHVLNSMSTTINIDGFGDNWVNLADLGAKIKSIGIDYNAYGYDKLRSFISSFASIEVHKDDSHTLPVYYVREKKTKTFGNKGKRNKELFDWAFLGYLPNTIAKLKEMALDEDWGEYTDEEERTQYPILNNYLKTTFHKLQLEKDKILISNDKDYAVFNTGLVDSRYKPIYALFKKNRDEKKRQEWYWVDFCIEGENRAGKTLVDQFSKMPLPAHYFNEVSDMLYDTKMERPKLDIEHIVLERVDRLPYEFLSSNAPIGFEILRTDSMTIEEKKDYFERLRIAIQKDGSTYRQLTNRIEDALDVALKRVQWNFKSAIPMYYPKKNKMCLLLPLSLIKDNKVDVALVVERTSSGRYQGATIYKLNWAYMYARLVCRPDSDWLSVANVSAEESDE